MKEIRSYHWLLSLILVLLFQSCKPQKNNWIIKGSTNQKADIVYLFEVSVEQDYLLVDSALVKEGKFEFKKSNTNDQLTAYAINFEKNPKTAVEFFIHNGNRMKVEVKDQFTSSFNGTEFAEDFNKYNQFRHIAMTELTGLSKRITANELSESDLKDTMLVFNERMQELENEKIDFLKTIQNPELNSSLILHEIFTNGIIEKELFAKYIGALTPEGAMTNVGHKIHQIYQEFDAFALSKEMNILDSVSIRERYNNLSEEGKNSAWGKLVLNYLEK